MPGIIPGPYTQTVCGEAHCFPSQLQRLNTRVKAGAETGQRQEPEQRQAAKRGGWSWEQAGCSWTCVKPDPHTLPSARINNYLNFFHLSRDSNTGKHGKGKGIDPSQLLPALPHCSHHSPHLTIWPPLPLPFSQAAAHCPTHRQPMGHPRRLTRQTRLGPHSLGAHLVSTHKRTVPHSVLLRMDKLGASGWGREPSPLRIARPLPPSLQESVFIFMSLKDKAGIS